MKLIALILSLLLSGCASHTYIYDSFGNELIHVKSDYDVVKWGPDGSIVMEQNKSAFELVFPALINKAPAINLHSGDDED